MDSNCSKAPAECGLSSTGRTMSILNSLGEAALVLTPELSVTDCNPAAEELFGYCRGELIGKGIGILFNSERARVNFADKCIAAVNHGKPAVEVEFSCVTKAGSVFPAEWKISPLGDSVGADSGTVALIRDISARKKSEEALRITEAHLEEAQRLAQLGSWLWEVNTGRVVWSQEAFRIFGFDPSAPISYDTFLTRVYPDDIELVMKAVDDSLYADEPFRIEHRMSRPDGSVRNLSGRGIVIFDEQHNPIRMIGSVQDVTDRVRAEETIRRSETRYRQLFENSPTVQLALDPLTGAILEANSAGLRFFGASLPELNSQSLPDFVVGPPERFIGKLAKAHMKIESFFPSLTMKVFGELRQVDLYMSPMEIQGKTALFTTIHDMTERKKAEKQLKLADQIIKTSNEAIVITDVQGHIEDVNDSFCRMTGYARDEVLGKDPGVMKSGRHEPLFYRNMWESLRREGFWQGEVWDRRKNGEVYPKLLSISSVRNENGETTHYVGLFSDITQIKQTEERLYRLAHFDPLTGLANRNLFRDRLNQAILDATRNKSIAALMMLDLDRFKNINDSMGHPAGDDLLVLIAGRLRSALRESDTIARLGGDEFTVVVPDLISISDAAHVARKLLDVINEPLMLRGREALVSASLGISLFPMDGGDADTLLQHADTALYAGKESGKNLFRFFSSQMNRELTEKTEMEAEMRAGIDKGEFRLHYQPVIDVATGTIVSAEALMRWYHPAKGIVPPGKFIALAEETGLIAPLGEWALREACAHLTHREKIGLPRVKVSVNLSGKQLKRAGFVDLVNEILDESGADPELLELELTESTALMDVENTISVLNALRDKGVSTCVDDFGTGYSSLSYLRMLPIRKLKIDKSFIEGIESYDANQPIVEAVIHVAHSLDLAVIAEGIETKAQLATLWLLNCDQWQGFFFSKPVPESEFQEMLKTGAQAPSFDTLWIPTSRDAKSDEEFRERLRRVDEMCDRIIAEKEGETLASLRREIELRNTLARAAFTDLNFSKSVGDLHETLVHKIARIRDGLVGVGPSRKRGFELLMRLHAELMGIIDGHEGTGDKKTGAGA